MRNRLRHSTSVLILIAALGFAASLTAGCQTAGHGRAAAGESAVAVPGPPPAPVAMPVASLEAQVASLTGQANPVLRGVASTVPGSISYKDASGSEFWVDAASAQVRFFFNSAAYEKGTAPVGPGESAILADAEARLRRAYSPGRLVRMKRTIRRLEGGAESDVWVNYREYIGDVATFNQMEFDYSAAGRLLNVNILDVDVSVGVRPKLTKDAAIKIAAGAGYTPVAGDGAKLTVARDPAGVQTLAWDVELYAPPHPDNPLRMALVDAQTGAVIQSARAAITY